MPRIAPPAGHALRALVLGTTLAAAGSAGAQTAPAPAKSAPPLRICASEVEAPFSQKDAASGQATGFENRIATVLAKAMGREAVFVWSPKAAIYQVRDGLDKNLCDVVMGIDTGDARVLSSKPYYRTSYVFVTKADRNVTTGDWQDPQIKALGRFVVRFYSPGETLLKRLGKYEDNAAYLYGLVNFKSPRNQYVEVPADRMVSEVASGEADVAFAFAPEVARYVKASTVPLRMTVATTDLARFDGTPIPLHYDQSIGVRKGDAALLQEVDAALAKARPDIDAILTEDGIPLLKPNS
ncbi:methanol oxidation system protein MoxJ [Xanthobacter sp. V4C-4]|uniref:methanol oxidation system protein MoxJ n=1 Tax=Xanthobacter cornucopiae TaxID=3119924 RepID=UPI003727903E